MAQGVEWIHLMQNKYNWWDLTNTLINL